MRGRPQIAVLGSGIMGSSVALLLARRGAAVSLFEQQAAPFAAASRWNEGKIHLGYLYSAHRSLDTARHILPGGLAFRQLTEQLIGTSLLPAITDHDDTYVVHAESVTGLDETRRYFAAVDDLVADLSAGPAGRHYLSDLAGARTRALPRRALEGHYATARLAGGFRVPERSVSTRWIADRFVAALHAEPRIALHTGTRVVAVRTPDGADDRLTVETERGTDGPFAAVVNALWEGRPAIDARLGLYPQAPWSHRFRLSVFLRTTRPVAVPSTVIATGPFGDVKNYGGRDFYLSWYPSGLRAEGSGLEPPPVAALDTAGRQDLVAQVLERLGGFIKPVADLAACTEAADVQGGWVYAVGQGSLADPLATIHRRDQPNIHRRGAYISVDTGKYSMAPLLALTVADMLLPDEG